MSRRGCAATTGRCRRRSTGSSTDRLADLLLTPSRDASETLRAKGEPEDEIEFVGNVMIDTLLHSLPTARASGFRDRIGAEGEHDRRHPAPSVNVDDPARLTRIATALRQLADRHTVVFPVHPRTRQRLADAGADLGGVRVLDPIGYFAMLDLVQGAYAVVTDSGGLQEETTALGVPCFTLRANTERPVTITEGTNELVPDPDHLVSRVESLRVERRGGRVPEGWDGQASKRIVECPRGKRRRWTAGGLSPRGLNAMRAATGQVAALVASSAVRLSRTIVLLVRCRSRREVHARIRAVGGLAPIWAGRC